MNEPRHTQYPPSDQSLVRDAIAINEPRIHDLSNVITALICQFEIHAAHPRALVGFNGAGKSPHFQTYPWVLPPRKGVNHDPALRWA